MQALPPLLSATLPLPSTTSSTFEAAFRPPSPCQYEIKAAPESDDEDSAYWNPEQETLHHLSALAAAAVASSSFSAPLVTSTRPAPGNKKRALYDFPSADEAASLATTTSARADEPEAAGDRKGKGKAHPITMAPAVDASWDFERMFTRNRQWDRGGKTSFGDEEEESNGSPLAVPIGGGKSRSTQGMDVDGEDVAATIAGSSTSELDAEELQRRAARQRETFEALRKVAMERLALLGAHLAWSGGSGAGK